jgi:hypothetical protein
VFFSFRLPADAAVAVENFTAISYGAVATSGGRMGGRGISTVPIEARVVFRFFGFSV